MAGIIGRMLAGAAESGGAAAQQVYTDQRRANHQKDRDKTQSDRAMALAKYRSDRGDAQEQMRFENNQTISNTNNERGIVRDKMKAKRDDARVDRGIVAGQARDDRADARGDKTRKHQEKLQENRLDAQSKSKGALKTGEDGSLYRIDSDGNASVITDANGEPFKLPKGVSKANLELADSYFSEGKKLMEGEGGFDSVEEGRKLMQKGRDVLSGKGPNLQWSTMPSAKKETAAGKLRAVIAKHPEKKENAIADFMTKLHMSRAEVDALLGGDTPPAGGTQSNNPASPSKRSQSAEPGASGNWGDAPQERGTIGGIIGKEIENGRRHAGINPAAGIAGYGSRGSQ